MNYNMVLEAAGYLKGKGIGHTDAAVILGTGLTGLASKIDLIQSIPYGHIPHFPEATVEFHKGQLLYGTIGNASVLVMQGRFHYYEGYTMQQVSFPVRVMKELGVPLLVLSNAAGGISPHLKKGDIVLVEDHINLLPDNPLRGIADPAFGSRFPDMSVPYSPQLCALLKKQALKKGIELKSGVYAAVMGPNLETRAEYRYLRAMGADMVGMSTVPEVIVANQAGLPCAAISVITDECDPDHLEPADISSIIAVATAADITLSELLASLVRELSGFR